MPERDVRGACCGLGCASSVVAGGEVVGAAIACVGEGGGCGAGGGREEEVGCACAGAGAGGGYLGAFLAELVPEAAGRHCRVAVGVFVDLGWRARGGAEEGFGVVHGGVLGQGGALDGAVEGPCYEAAPEEDAHGHEAEDGSDDDEDRAVGEVALLHEGGLLGVGHDGCDDCSYARQCW